MAWLCRFDDFNNIDIDTREPFTAGQIQAQKKITNKEIQHASHKLGGQEYCRIRNITNAMPNVSIAGVIIAKEGPKSIVSKKSSGNERHLLAFTVCDEPSSFINITCWGDRTFIHRYASEFAIGHVVDIKGANVQTKSNNPSDEKYKPWTPGCYQLNVSENQGTLAHYSGTDTSVYLKLMHVPTRANNNFYTLEDIEANGMNLQGEHINILVVVKKIWPMREIVTKFGKKTSKVDVIVCDESCPSFNLTLWGSNVELAKTWISMETVLFAADVRISCNEFRSVMVASTDSKTIFTVDPDTPESQSVRHFCQTQGFPLSWDNNGNSFGSDGKDPDTDSISNVITVREAKDLQTDLSFNDGQAKYGVIFAFLSNFDVDSDEKLVFRDVCYKCRKTVYEDSYYECGNSDCKITDAPFKNSIDVEYSFAVSLSDHTGTLDFCYVPPFLAEHLLGYKAKDFKNLAGMSKTAIKWTYLLERVKAVIKVKKTSGVKAKCIVQIMTLEKPSADQLLEHGFSDI